MKNIYYLQHDKDFCFETYSEEHSTGCDFTSGNITVMNIFQILVKGEGRIFFDMNEGENDIEWSEIHITMLDSDGYEIGCAFRTGEVKDASIDLLLSKFGLDLYDLAHNSL